MRGETATLANLNSASSSKDYCLICGRQNHTTEKCNKRAKGPAAASGDGRDQNRKRDGNKNKGGQKKTQQSNREGNKSKPESAISANMIVKSKCQLNYMNDNKSTWYLDSGATHHAVSSPDIVHDVVKRTDVTLESANGSDLGATGFGQVSIKAGSVDLNLKDVVLAPQLQANFLSVSKLVKANFSVKFFKRNDASIADITYGDELMCRAIEENELLKIKNIEPKLCNTALKTIDNDSVIRHWHRRLGHVNFGDLLRLRSELQIKSSGNKLNCDTCDIAKCHRLPF